MDWNPQALFAAFQTCRELFLFDRDASFRGSFNLDLSILCVLNDF